MIPAESPSRSRRRCVFCPPIKNPDNVCNVPHRRALEQNGIVSLANRIPATRHATIDATQDYGHQKALPTVAPKPCRETFPL
ncbi:hypothetical protein AC579_3731 [Pseudocercospora musae]|uniref:Uncharacterized protein n=1 Tax=Pseudocercospora musae TaxID=113226 RepID=A0A139H096_9PEZI|nr:hypothetical protein AC579_3731 [Pseudocercospora musae]